MIKISGSTPFALGAMAAIFGGPYERGEGVLGAEPEQEGFENGAAWVRFWYPYSERFYALSELMKDGTIEASSDVLTELRLRAALLEASEQINKAKLLYPQVFDQDGTHKTAVMLEECRIWLERVIAGTESRLARREREVAP